MAFSGNLAEHSYVDLLEALIKGDKTGCLEVVSPYASFALYFREGGIVSYVARDSQEQLLVDRRLITLQERNAALFKFLVANRVKDIIIESLGLQSGDFAFHSPPRKEPPFELEQAIPSHSLLFDCLRMRDEWLHRKRQDLGPSTVVRLLSHPIEAETLENERTMRIINELTQPRSVARLSFATGTPAYELLVMLVSMEESGIVEFEVGGPETNGANDASSAHTGSSTLPAEEVQMDHDEYFERIRAATTIVVFFSEIESRKEFLSFILHCVKQGKEFSLQTTIKTLASFLVADAPRRDAKAAVEMLCKVYRLLVMYSKTDHLQTLFKVFATFVVQDDGSTGLLKVTSTLLKHADESRSLMAGEWMSVIDAYCKRLDAMPELNEQQTRLVLQLLFKASDRVEVRKAIFRSLDNPKLFKHVKGEFSRDLHLFADGLTALLATSDHKEIRHSVMLLLRELGTDSQPHIFRLLDQDPPWYVVRNGMLLLGEIGDKKALPHIFRYTRDSNPSIRRYAMGALNRLSPGECMELASAMLNSAKVEDRRIALELIAREGSKRLMPRVARSLHFQNIPNREDLVAYFNEACAMLGTEGSEREALIIAELLEDTAFISQRANVPLMAALIRALLPNAKGWAVNTLETVVTRGHMKIIDTASQALNHLRRQHRTNDPNEDERPVRVAPHRRSGNPESLSLLNYYALLEVSQEAPEAQIVEAYNAKVNQCKREQNLEMIDTLNRALTTLLDKEKRQAYNELLTAHR